MSAWKELEKVISPHVLEDARRVSAALVELGIPHALVGGLAVGIHGYPRVTKDVDFLVGPEAFAETEPLLRFRDELADVVRWGVIDLIAALPEDPILAGEVRHGSVDAIPVAGIEVLVVMKLRAGRTQDTADVEALVRAGADVASIVDFIKRFEPQHLAEFSAIAQRGLKPTDSK
jgi:hypothetical protein